MLQEINVLYQIDDHILCLAIFLSVNMTVLQYIYHLPVYVFKCIINAMS